MNPNSILNSDFEVAEEQKGSTRSILPPNTNKAPKFISSINSVSKLKQEQGKEQVSKLNNTSIILSKSKSSTNNSRSTTKSTCCFKFLSCCKDKDVEEELDHDLDLSM